MRRNADGNTGSSRKRPGRQRLGTLAQLSLFALLLLAVVAAIAVKFGPPLLKSAQTPEQTLPSPYYAMDVLEYFPPGPEFKLPSEPARPQEEAKAAKIQTGGVYRGN